MKRPVLTASPSRRDLLYHSGMGLGAVALSALLHKERAQAGPLAPTRGHHGAKAKNCIFLLMEGGPSHIDTFDPKPKLVDLHLTEFVKERNKFEANMNTGKRYFVRSPFEFRRAGKMGIEINAKLANFADCVDDVCFYRGLQATSVNHPTALYHLNTGNRFGGDPAIGSWVTYGLGDGEPEPAGLRGPPGSGVSAGRSGELVKRIPASSLPGNAAAVSRCAGLGHETACIRDGLPAAQDVRLARTTESKPFAAASASRRAGFANRELRVGVSDAG